MEPSTRRKIAYYMANDARDKRTWSGTPYYLAQALQKNIGDVYFFEPSKLPRALNKTLYLIQQFTKFAFKTEFIPKFSLIRNVFISRHLKKQMKGQQFDLIFAPAAALELAYLNTNLPIVYFSDTTYKLYSETYTNTFKHVSSYSKRQGNYLEKRSLQKSNVVILTSEWAAESAMKDYQIPENKIEIILLGANIDTVPDKGIIFDKEKNKTLTLLFLAVDWERKGGDIAFDALVQLHAMGVKAKLIVCGVIPPKEFTHPYMEVIPFLNKNKPEDSIKFSEILSSVHMLLLPTRADCSLLVNAEANAYGVPTISTCVGGVPDVVKDGVNGYCLPVSAKGKDYADIINKVFNNKEEFHQLIISSRNRFDEILNWDKFTGFLAEVLKKHNV